MQNNYNNALVEQQGNYSKKLKESDAYNMSVDKLNAMLFKNEIEDMVSKIEKSLLEERALWVFY